MNQSAAAQEGALKTILSTALNSKAKKVRKFLRLNCQVINNSISFQALAIGILVCVAAMIKSGKSVKDPNVSYKGQKESRARSSAGKGNVDALFWQRIKKLLRTVFTSYTCQEAQYIYTLTVLLVIRTFMSIWLADVNGRVVKAIVNKSFTEFLQRVIAKTSALFIRN